MAPAETVGAQTPRAPGSEREGAARAPAGAGSPLLAVDDLELVGARGEGIEAVLGHHAVVLQAHAAHAGQVDAGLNGDDGARLDDVLLRPKLGSSWMSIPTPCPRPWP